MPNITQGEATRRERAIAQAIHALVTSIMEPAYRAFDAPAHKLEKYVHAVVTGDTKSGAWSKLGCPLSHSKLTAEQQDFERVIWQFVLHAGLVLGLEGYYGSSSNEDEDRS